ncbi:MAG TPA: glutathionylspermidine synthase family protein [Verrucomicrobiae bacterium]|nr:glutathionylspermidine synthase family protein [Verrucomicrobiae bacterium]
MWRKHDAEPRQGWRAQVHSEGLVYNHALLPDGKMVDYWREDAYYVLSPTEVEVLEKATDRLYGMYYDLTEHLLGRSDIRSILEGLTVPYKALPEIRRSWEEDSPSVYGRFDIRFAGDCELSKADPSLQIPKLLEFNADTPTTLFEASVVQWNWLNFAKHIGETQWNNMHEMLIEAWKRQVGVFERQVNRTVDCIYFAFSTEDTSGEDLVNTAYLAETAAQAGFKVELISVESLDVFDVTGGSFFYMNKQGKAIDLIFKLYPWEWLTDVKYPPYLKHGTTWIEPPYKLLWSNKGFLALLWKQFGNDSELSQYLLPTFFADEQHTLTDFVRKPLLSREGANIEIVRNGKAVLSTPGNYSKGNYIVQQFAGLPNFRSPFSGDNHHPMLGAWVVDGESAGLGIRESPGLVTDNTSCFVPHVVTQ